ncbi:unnamed protein product [Onchocerca ochengi]|uniref:Uncharacterized protein n=1 Tax=Onchocerca ochengi TaxID=42157 RepID=A0A182EBB9_ONCOC|nr:unnamed protein product [Onchocerca ochengi]
MQISRNERKFLGAEEKSGVKIAKANLQMKRKMNNNDNTASEKANIAVSGMQTLNWNSSVNNWMDYENENNRDSGTSSSDGIPTSDAPTSSTTSTNITIFDAFLQAGNTLPYFSRRKSYGFKRLLTQQPSAGSKKIA